jgi:GT2 family glycosyltransferase
MDVSVCIVNYRATQFLLRCLRSIAGSAPECSLEIIVVDNASPDFDREAALAEMAEAKIVENDSNRGYAAASNQAIELSTGEFVLLCNPDIELEGKTIETLRSFLADHPGAAAAAPQLIYHSGRIQWSCRGFPRPAGLFFEIVGLARIFRHSEWLGSYRMRYFDHRETREIEQPMASLLMLRRTAIEDVGLLDERFPIFGNDVDWAMRAAERGWTIHFVAGARAVHHHGQSTKHMGARRALESSRSLGLLYKKHYKGRIPALVYFPMVALIAAAGFVKAAGLAVRYGFRRGA